MSLRQPTHYLAKHYSWQDADAPQLSDTDGCIKTILKACLVTGYGDKKGAGWAMPFEEPYKMVLRTPKRTGQLPDVKIENGTFEFNGAEVTRHRITSYDYESCTGLDDTNEITSVNLVTRDAFCGQEWHLIATDFGFIFCYQMGEYNRSKNNILLVSALQKLDDASDDMFIVNGHNNYEDDGKARPWSRGFLDAAVDFINLKNDVKYNKKHYLNFLSQEKQINNDYLAQRVVIDDVAALPFFTSLSDDVSDMTTAIVSIDNRQMLRYVNKMYQNYTSRVIYIPIDYWEL